MRPVAGSRSASADTDCFEALDFFNISDGGGAAQSCQTRCMGPAQVCDMCHRYPWLDLPIRLIMLLLSSLLPLELLVSWPIPHIKC